MMELPVRIRQKMTVKKLRFLGEQEGRPERMLKEKLAASSDFGREIDRAYLARVYFENRSEASVTLCLRAYSGDQEKLVNYVGAAFSNLFNSKEHLDVIFISDEQETQLREVCRPFFVKELRCT
jgi:hypothetical protein